MESMRSVPPGIDMQKASSILTARNKEISDTCAQIEMMQKERDSVEILMNMKRKDRIAQARELYTECYHQKSKDSHAEWIGIAIIAGTATACFAGALTGNTNGLLFISILPIPFAGPAIVKKILLSDKKIDTLMQDKLNGRMQQIEQGLSNARKHLDDVRAGAIAKAAAEANNSSPEQGIVLDDEQFVVVDGLRLKKNESGSMQFLPSFMKTKKEG